MKPAITREPSSIRSTVRAHYRDLQACYQQGLGRNAKLKGRVGFEFSINGEGIVEYQCIRDTTLEDQASVECMLTVFENMTFAAMEQSGHTRVVYPLKFLPDVSNE